MLISIVQRSPDQFKVEAKDQKHIVILDDSKILLTLWEMNIDYKQLHFLKPENFFAALEQDPNILKNAKCIVSDYFFGSDNSEYNGISFALKLRVYDTETPIFLSSDYDFSNVEIDDIIDGIVDKDCELAWAKIKSELSL